MTAPALVLGFNRPDKLELCLKAIKGTTINNLVIILDGPRLNSNDEIKIASCVKVAESYRDSFKQFKLIERDTNLGCRNGVQDALNQFFSEHDSGMIIEDDILISQGFVDFCTWALSAHMNDPNIWVINGWSPFERGEIELLPWLSRIPTVWGWATWADRWKNYNPDIEVSAGVIPSEMKTNLSLPMNLEFNKYWTECFKVIREGWNTWDYQLVFSMWNSGGMALSSPIRMTQNIGFDDSATHTFRARGRSNSPIDLQGLDKNSFAALNSDLGLIARSEEIQFGYRIKHQDKNRLRLKMDRFSSIVVFIAESFDKSEFAKKSKGSNLDRFARRAARFAFFNARVKTRVLNSTTRVSRILNRITQYLYWGIKSRVSRLNLMSKGFTNYLYWGIKSRVSRLNLIGKRFANYLYWGIKSRMKRYFRK